MFILVLFAQLLNNYIMVKFFLYLTYEGEEVPRLVAEGCSQEQLLEVLSRHLMLAEVDHFEIIPVEC